MRISQTSMFVYMYVVAVLVSAYFWHSQLRYGMVENADCVIASSSNAWWVCGD